MSLRDYLNGRLSGLDQDIEQGGLDEYGLGDLPADSFSTALLHFAEQSPMETADALAPIVTRLSPVPFEAGDLPDSPEAEAILADGGDVFDLLDELAPADASLGSIYDDADPSSFDDDADLDDETEMDDDLESGLDVDDDERFDNDRFDDEDLDEADGDDEADDLLDETDELEETDDLEDNGSYGGGEDIDQDQDDDEDDDQPAMVDADEDDDLDDLDELGDFERVDHDLGSEQLHPVDEGSYDEVADPEEGDDPAEIGFDLE